MDEWINKMWSIPTREFSFIQLLKKDRSTNIWMNPENIMPEERSQDKKTPILWFHLHEMSIMGKSIQTESRLVGATGWGIGRWDQECLFNFFLPSCIYSSGDGCTTPWIQWKSLQNNLNEFHVTEFHLKCLKNDMRY